MITNTLGLLEMIKGTSSRTEKESLIKTGVNNEVFSNLLKVTFDPYLLYYIKKIPEYTPIGKTSSGNEERARYEEFCSLLNSLNTREIVGNEALEEVSNFLSSCTETEAYWYSLVIQKDLKIGATEKTINKVFGKGFIPEFGCMLAEPVKNVDKDLPKEFIIEPKLDGMRLLAFHREPGEVTLISRNGKLIFGYDELEEEIKKLPAYSVYDGEIMSVEFEKKLMELIKAYHNNTKVELDNSQFNDLMSYAFKKTSGKIGVFNIFDMIDINDFDKGVSSTPLIDRKLELMEVMSGIDSSCLKLHVHRGIFNKSEPLDMEAVYKAYDYYCAIGYEGVMIKDITTPYKFKRSKSLLKLKPMDFLDLEVVGLEEGTGRNQGKLGAAIVEHKGYKVNVGSGFTDEEREKYWNNPNLLVGKTIMVMVQEETTNKNNTISLRFPTFKGIRLDK